MTLAAETFDPRDYVDCDDHQAHLRNMVQGRIGSRAVVISDESGQGKSSLLLRLRLNCLEEDPSAAVLFLDARDLTAPFVVLQRSYHDARNEVTFADHFPRFSDAYFDWSTTARVDVSGGGARVELNAQHASVSNSIVTGLNVTAAPAGVENAAAQRAIMTAFADDLRLCQRQQCLVIIVDHYNRADPPLRTWLDERLLRPCLLAELPAVVLVLASTPDVQPSYAASLADRLTLMPLNRLHGNLVLVQNLITAHRLDVRTGISLDQLTRAALVLFDMGFTPHDVIGALLQRVRGAAHA